MEVYKNDINDRYFTMIEANSQMPHVTSDFIRSKARLKQAYKTEGNVEYVSKSFIFDLIRNCHVSFGR